MTPFLGHMTGNWKIGCGAIVQTAVLYHLMKVQMYFDLYSHF